MVMQARVRKERPSANRPIMVSLLALPETTPTSLYGFYEVFAAIGVTWETLTGQSTKLTPPSVRLVSGRRRSFKSTLGLTITPHLSFAEVKRSDIVIVTDLALQPETDPRGRWREAIVWLRKQYRQGALVASVCTGSILLAEAGLLEAEEATTHWSACDVFARCYPAVKLRPERILSPAGEAHRIITAGGMSSWENLALYLVARFFGEVEAVRIAKIFLFGDRSDGQLPFAALSRPRRHDDAVIAHCQSWIADHYALGNPVARMVRQSGLPERTFKRRFKTATGYAPVEYVQALRIEEAKQHLESTSAPVDVIAREVGYEDPTFFRRLFKRRTGVTPARYRQRFQSVLRPGRLTRSAPDEAHATKHQ